LNKALKTEQDVIKFKTFVSGNI